MKEIPDNPRFAIGQQYIPSGQARRVYTVADILRTYNARGALVRLRYVGVTQFMGQTLTDHDVCETTIARGAF